MKQIIVLLSIFTTFATFSSAYFPVNSCGSLNVPGVYSLQNDVTVPFESQEPCFTFNSDSIILDCNSYRINSTYVDFGETWDLIPLADGILINGRYNATIKNCVFEKLDDAIQIDGNVGVLIENNTIRNNGGAIQRRLGIKSDGITIRNNYLESNHYTYFKWDPYYNWHWVIYGSGVYLQASNSLVENNTITDTQSTSYGGCGLFIEGSNNHVRNNILIQNTCGIKLTEAQNTLLENNFIDGYGTNGELIFALFGTSNNSIIRGNTLIGSVVLKPNSKFPSKVQTDSLTQVPIYDEAAAGWGYTITNNTFNFTGFNLLLGSNNIFSGNNVFSPFEFSSMSNLNIKKNEFKNVPIYLSVIDANISNNSFENSSINLINSVNNYVCDNIMKLNAGDGILLNNSVNNHVCNNRIFDNSGSGIKSDSGLNNQFYNNEINNNLNRGIDLSDSGSLVKSNKILSNGIGISVTGPSNLIYNNLFSNSINVFGPTVTSTIWQISKTLGTNVVGGAYLAGNFWSDYYGLDLNWDDIGDTLIPYTSSGNITGIGDVAPLVYPASYICGDMNGNGHVNVVDVTYLVKYLFQSGPAPIPLKAGDVNLDGKVNVIDLSYLSNYLYRDGPTPCFGILSKGQETHYLKIIELN
ncbi:right-handed parallel beta-helix repeat-containing protein [Candidatus Micrarchaeota archaeon]|nr:right-handed parallel beta-helix repeat-containing protein [Candidatus Micrarchaeota archaeon]